MYYVMSYIRLVSSQFVPSLQSDKQNETKKSGPASSITAAASTAESSRLSNDVFVYQFVNSPVESTKDCHC